MFADLFGQTSTPPTQSPAELVRAACDAARALDQLGTPPPPPPAPAAAAAGGSGGGEAEAAAATEAAARAEAAAKAAVVTRPVAEMKRMLYGTPEQASDQRSAVSGQCAVGGGQ